MKTLRILTLLLLAAGPIVGRSGTPPPLTVAALDITTPDAALAAEAGNLTALLGAYLSAENALILVERQQLDVALGEQALGASGMISPQEAAKVGQLTGAKVILISRIFAQGKSLTLVTKLISTETGRVFSEVDTLPPGDKRNSVLKAFAGRLAGTLQQHATVLVAKPETPDEQAARIAKLTADKKLPSVSVNLPETHLTRRVVDPAAETEMVRTLGQAGFTVLTPGAPTPAQIQITGEAFSELALRRGDFVSCRARVEIKVVEVATGRVLLQDRQTEVGVDLAESVAAKNALQKAGRALVERIVERLTAAR